MGGYGFSILVADDDQQRNDLLTKLLESSGFSVLSVYSGVDAITAIQENSHDMLLLDVRLPDMSGFDVLKVIKQENNCRDCFIIMISSILITSVDQSKGFESGADGYIVFPMSNREFKARINAFVRHKKTLDHLRQSEYMLRSVFENSEDGIIMLDPEGKITFANKVAHRMFARSPGHMNDLFFGTPITSGGKTIIDIPNGPDALTVELKLINLDHDDHSVSIAYLRDITERRQREEKMSERLDLMLCNERQQDKIFSLIAHDLRSPFNNLIGLTDFLVSEMEHLSRTEIVKHISSVNKSAQKVFALLLNLLDWSRLKSGSWRSENKRILLAELVNDVMALYVEMANAKNIALQNNVDATLTLYADYNVLHSVFRNLIMNSIKFTSPGGYVMANAIPAGDKMILSVTDNGAGMTTEKMNILFDKDHLGEKSHPESGTGLGLQLCKELVESAGGRMEFTSSEGQGTTASFIMPDRTGS